MIIPPGDEFNRGRVTFVASEPVQFVSLIGPLGPGENKGQPTWTAKGKTLDLHSSRQIKPAELGSFLETALHFTA